MTQPGLAARNDQTQHMVLAVVCLVTLQVAALVLVASVPADVGASSACPGLLYIGQATAEHIALEEASARQFVSATITAAEMVNGEYAQEYRLLNLAMPVACVWYVKMSGEKDDVFFGTPTPGAFVEMHVAVNASDSDINARGYFGEPTIVTTLTVTPSSTPTAGATPTDWPTPTAAGTPTP